MRIRVVAEIGPWPSAMVSDWGDAVDKLYQYPNPKQEGNKYKVNYNITGATPRHTSVRYAGQQDSRALWSQGLRFCSEIGAGFRTWSGYICYRNPSPK